MERGTASAHLATPSHHLPIPNWSISKAWGQGCIESFDHGDHTGVDTSVPECSCSGGSWQEGWAALKPLGVCLSVSSLCPPCGDTYRNAHPNYLAVAAFLKRAYANKLIAHDYFCESCRCLFIVCGLPPVASRAFTKHVIVPAQMLIGEAGCGKMWYPTDPYWVKRQGYAPLMDAYSRWKIALSAKFFRAWVRNAGHVASAAQKSFAGWPKLGLKEVKYSTV